MSGDVLPVIAAVVGASAGGVGIWVLGRRVSSGRIDTSEAAVLWQASESIRHDLTAALKTQTEELEKMRAKVMDLAVQVEVLRAENARLNLVFEKFKPRMVGD